MISYVSFSATASRQDSSKIKQSLEELKPKFAADTSAKSFLVRNSSAIDFSDGYTPKAKMQTPEPAKDSILALADGGSFRALPGWQKTMFLLKKFQQKYYQIVLNAGIFY